MASFSFLDHPGPIPFAHRGGAIEAPENTLAAFEVAVALGYRYLETDVRISADGVVMAFHDDDLLRTTGHSGRISELPWSVLRSMRIDGREPIPRLDELLSSFPTARVNIDCKSDAAVDGLVEVLHRAGAWDRVCLGGFSAARLRRLRSLAPRTVCTSMGPTEVARWLMTSRRVHAVEPPAPCAQIPTRLGPLALITAGMIQRSHRHGLAVHAWTIDEASEMERLIDLGVDGIMTDRPVVLKAVLQRRGLWV